MPQIQELNQKEIDCIAGGNYITSLFGTIGVLAGPLIIGVATYRRLSRFKVLSFQLSKKINLACAATLGLGSAIVTHKIGKMCGFLVSSLIEIGSDIKITFCGDDGQNKQTECICD